MDVFLLIIRLILFAIFALSAVGKFLDLKGAEKAVKDFGTPDELAKPLAVAIPFAEIVFAFCFLFPSTSWVGALGALILLLSFTGGMIWQLAQGNSPDCHCFGQISSEPVSRSTVVRNIIFSILALVLIARGRDGQGMSLTDDNSDSMQLILIFLLLTLVAAALFYLRKVLGNQTEILRRIDLLELLSNEGVPLERNEAGLPQDGLPIGSPFPEFELKDTSDRTVSLQGFLADGRPAVFFFVHPTCEPCKALLPEMERWEAELGKRVNFVVVSGGDREANVRRFQGVFENEIVLQEKREVADAIRARWTPTAIFVRTDGTIGSYLAAGDEAIKQLIEKIRGEDLSRSHLYFPGKSDNGARPPKIGETLPDFSVEDINGNRITARDLLGKPTLAVFWSLTCPHCKSMMDDLREWNKVRSESDPQLIVFSDGARESHKGINLDAPVVLDDHHHTAAKLGMFGTPSAVLIDSSGTFVTETGVGVSNVWALIGKRKG